MAKMGSIRNPKAFNDIKKHDIEQVKSERPTKRLKALLEEDETSNEEDSVFSNDGAVPMRNVKQSPSNHGFKVNQEFARRFEHNKKREELHKREESILDLLEITC